MSDGFADIDDAWSRPWKIPTVLARLGMRVPDRLRREHFEKMRANLKREGIEVKLADDTPADAWRPTIEGKVRLRRAREVLFGKYEVLGAIAVGGMSRSGGCYKVRSTETNETLFLKLVSGTKQDELAAIKREASNYQRLEQSSPKHVLTLRAFEQDGDTVGIVTEFADGGTLRSFVESKGGRLPVEGARAVLLDVLSGLAELHASSIIHRDLKPDNVLLASGAWKLGDLGISKSLVRLITTGKTFQGAGTEAYAAPEQLAVNVTAHPTMDVYGFGKVATFVLTGKPDGTVTDERWSDLIRRCTAADPDERPSRETLTYEVARL